MTNWRFVVTDLNLIVCVCFFNFPFFVSIAMHPVRCYDTRFSVFIYYDPQKSTHCFNNKYI